MKKQGYNDRLDESLGMRDGKASGKMQNYKDRRSEARSMNDRYGNPAKGKTMGHDKAPSKLDAMPMNMGKGGKCPNRGYDSKAYDYSY